MTNDQQTVLDTVIELVQRDGRCAFPVKMVAKYSKIEESKLWSDEEDLILMQLDNMGYLIVDRRDGSVQLDSDELC